MVILFFLVVILIFIYVVIEIISEKNYNIKVNEIIANNYNLIQEFYNSLDGHYIANREIVSAKDKYNSLYESNKSIRTWLKDEYVEKFIKDYSNLKEYCKRKNKEFIQEELIKEKEFFDNVLKYPLDEDQRKAIIIDDDVNLVVAGAGSGKTSTMIGKIKYLIDRKNVNPSKILAISFTNNAVNNLKSQLNIDDVECMTFHSLGNSILKEFAEEKHTIEDNSLHRLENIIFKYLGEIVVKDEKKLREFVEFFSIYMHYHDADTIQSFNDQINYENGFDLTTIKGKIYSIEKRERQDNELETFNNEIVRSYEELVIANYLFLNGINYEYEKTYLINDKAINYKPDFYLTDYNIYIEHFGISKDKRARQYSPGIENKYLEGIKWKRNIHKENNTDLIETYSYQYLDGNLLENLKSKLTSKGVKFKRIELEQIYEVIMNQNYKEEMLGIINLIQRFITVFKGNNYPINKFDEFIQATKEIKNKYQSKREKIFLSMVKEIYEIYQNSLKEDNKIDFNDMINLAKIEIEKGNYNKELDYIIVDEYQDISYTRYKLLERLQKKTNAKLVFVGDDWQSIYRFTGSNLDLFVNINKFFKATQIMKINRTYRNSQELIDIAGTFIMKNEKGQMQKTLISSKKEEYPINFYYYEKNMGKALEKAIQDLVDEGCKSILLLARNVDELKNYCENYEKILFEFRRKNIDIDYKTVHKAKGLEADGSIILGLRNSINGFPNKMEDDIVLRYVLPLGDSYLYEEERRIFYVALTRTKTKTSLLIPNYRKSEFIDELSEIGGKRIKVIQVEENEIENNPNCPNCEVGKLVIRENPQNNRKFVACINYPRCDFKSPYLEIITDSMSCPSCNGFLIRKKGKYSEFYGCTNYPNCKEVAKIEETEDYEN